MKRGKVIVVGAGVGGLAAAALLAARGLDVLVLERDRDVGGKLRAERVGDRFVDAGPTVFTMRWVFEELFDAAGEHLADHLSLVPARTLARHAWADAGRVSCLDLHADLEQTVDAIGRLAGAADARGYRAFCRRAAAIHDALEAPYLRGACTSVGGLVWRAGLGGLPGLLRISPFARLWPELGRHFRDPRLQQLFGRYATYCGSSPWLAPATLMLVAHVERSGVWRVDGGMREVGRALARLAERGGARLRVDCPVEEIVVEQGRATGVRLHDGEVMQADAVIFNGDVGALACGRLGPAASTGMSAHAARWRAGDARSLSALTWCAVARTSGFPLAHHDVFFSRDYAAEFDALAAGRLPAEPTVYVCAQDRSDDGEPPSDAERLFILVNAPAVADRRRLTEQEIATCETRAFRHLANCGLTLDVSAPMQRTTPSDFEHRFPATGGALYGPATHGWRASFSRLGARHPLPGLYLAGGSTHPGPGLPMAALSGRQAAAAVCADLAST